MANEQDLSVAMSAAAQDAVDHAGKAHGITLDYSEASIPDVERILGTVHDQYARRGFFGRLLGRGPTESDLKLGAMMFGGYTGEVLRKAINGKWELREGVPAVSNDKGTVFPIDKVYKRMANGPEDDVVFFFSRALAHLK
jgi:hypothetical protein